MAVHISVVGCLWQLAKNEGISIDFFFFPISSGRQMVSLLCITGILVQQQDGLINQSFPVCL